MIGLARTYDDALIEANDLRSEGGENLEYDRALVELIARLWAVPGMFTSDRAAEVLEDMDRKRAQV